MNTKNIMIIGMGPHSRRIYYPIIKKFGNQIGAVVRCVVDIDSQKEKIVEYLNSFEDKNIPRTFFIPETELSYKKINPSIEKALDILIKEYSIQGVIIATEPLTHYQYAKWALKNKLHILMDKPISTALNVSTNELAAKSLIIDYEDLYKDYKEIKKQGIGFTMMAQRRYHPAFIKMRNLIKEVYLKTGCPITSIQTFHSDGQWRMPSEIIDQIYHPYCQGYGKVSHSGYHTIDIINWLIETTESEDRIIDSVDIYSSFVRPVDFLAQIPLNKYGSYFKDFDKYNKYNQSECFSKMHSFGEIDAFNNFTFKSNNKVICLASNNLVHNGFSQRNWVTAKNRDLYKGNGRVRQESYIIEQGPFQSISYMSYQGSEVNTENLKNIYDFGGEYHLDIHVFRNDKMFPEWKNHEYISIKDLSVNILEGKSRGHQEDARLNAVKDFINKIHNPSHVLSSDLSEHKRGVILTSGIYQSAARLYEGNNPFISLSYTNQ